jgi:hypothetical protein
MTHHRQAGLFVLAILLVFLWFGKIAGPALASSTGLALATLPSEDSPPTATVSRPELPLPRTEIVTLPLIEQNSGDRFLAPVVESLVLQETPVPDSPGPSPTPTSTPLPPQTGAANLPIVIGAAAIYLIVILAWLLVGWRPRSSQGL